jgi:hypothetical protein
MDMRTSASEHEENDKEKVEHEASQRKERQKMLVVSDHRVLYILVPKAIHQSFHPKRVNTTTQCDSVTRSERDFC